MESKSESNGLKKLAISAPAPPAQVEPPLPSREEMIDQIQKTLLHNPRHLERYIESLAPAERDLLKSQVEQDMKDEEAKKPRFILGSESVWREKIFKAMEPVYEVIKPDIDEKSITLPDTDERANSDPAKLTMAIARAKAENILETFMESPFLSDRLLVTCDQVAVFNKQIREKPKDAAEAKKWIAQYVAKPVETFTSVVVTNIKTKERFEGTDTASQQFKKIPAKVLSEIIEKGDILKCCGGFMVDEPAIAPFLGKRTGTLSSLQGFPRNLVRRLLNEAQKIEGKEEKEEETASSEPEAPVAAKKKKSRAKKKKAKQDEDEDEEEEEEDQDMEETKSKTPTASSVTHTGSSSLQHAPSAAHHPSTAASAAAAVATAAQSAHSMSHGMGGMPLGTMPLQMPSHPVPLQMMPLAPMASPTSPGGADKLPQRRGRGRPPKAVPKKEKKPPSTPSATGIGVPSSPTPNLPTSPLPVPSSPPVGSPLSPVVSPKEKKAKPKKGKAKTKGEEEAEEASQPAPELVTEEKEKKPKAKKPSAKKGKKPAAVEADEVATAVDAAVAAAAGDKELSTENKGAAAAAKPKETPKSTRPKRDRKKRKLSDEEEEE